MSVARALAASMISVWILASGASAQTYPDRPITMIVAFPPGGADDATARIIDPMEKMLGQPIVIENIGGAGGMIAAAKAARAAPDGYTILLHQDSLAAGMTLYPNRTFDAEKDFAAIGLINMATTTLAARPLTRSCSWAGVGLGRQCSYEKQWLLPVLPVLLHLLQDLQSALYSFQVPIIRIAAAQTYPPPS